MRINTSNIISASGVAFGTSGARGLVTQFSPAVCAAFTTAFVSVMRHEFSFERVALAIDNRPSSYQMAMSCAKALEQVGIQTVYYGVVPTPALAFVAMQDQIPAIMVTGSHIPFDRNGLKFYRPDGEISKADEQAILAAKVTFPEISELPELSASGRAGQAYLERYTSLFSGPWLTGKRIGIYEHSSAGRDLYAELFQALGAEVVTLDRSDEFVPIDTEAVSEEDKYKARQWSAQYQFDAIFSTDGDGDRPLIADENGEWLRGDILGLLCSQALGINALSVPVSCNTAIEGCGTFDHVTRTKIGSPYVIAEFGSLAKVFDAVAGFEANGGYLLGSDVSFNDNTLTALPTRDAVLPALMLLWAAGQGTISALVGLLPKRVTYSDRIKDFPMEQSWAIIQAGLESPEQLLNQLSIAASVVSVNDTDGLRLKLDNGQIVHLRPSGNAPELRCYAEADNAEEAQRLVEQALSNLRKAR